MAAGERARAGAARHAAVAALRAAVCPAHVHTTGDIDAHELAIDAKDQLVFVNTKYSCLATL
ncbi:MAG: DUF4915 domain-containing protein, partial [Methyloceanibacter sp.]